MGNAVLHYSATPKSEVPGATGGVTDPSMSHPQPFSPPSHQQPSPAKASIPPSAQRAHFPGGEGMQKQQIPANLPLHHQQQDPMAPVGPHAAAQNQGYPNVFQRTPSSSSTSSQAWDPNSSGGSIGMPQKMDLNASSSSVQSIPSARTPHKVGTQGSADSNKGYAQSYSNQMMSTDQQGRAFVNFQPISHPAGVPPHQRAQSPPQATGPMQRQPFRQNLQQQGIGGGHQQQQFTGSPQGGHMIPPNPGEHTRPSSGPISFPNLDQVAEDQREGLWMGGAHQPQPQQQPQRQQRAQKSNSGHLYQINPQPGYGNQGKAGKHYKECYIPLVYVVWFCSCG